MQRERDPLAGFDAIGERTSTVAPKAPDNDDPEAIDGAVSVDAMGRSVIPLGGDLRRVADDAVRALARAPGVFQRGTVGLCRIIVAKDPPASLSEKQRARMPAAGDAVIEPMPHALLTEALSDVAVFVKRDARIKTGWRRLDAAPAPLVSQVLARRAYPDDPAPPLLDGLTEAPVMRRDGTVVTAPGYDPSTCLYLHWKGPHVEVPEGPTRDDARASYARLRALFSTFHYQGDDTARETMIAATVAAMLTPLVRFAMGAGTSAPGFMWSATDVASGKSTMAKACGVAVLGRIPAATQYTNDDDEMAKRAASIASTGRPVWFLDNVRASVEGSTLEQVLTCDGAYEARMLGTNEPRRMNWNSTIYMTGNGASYSPDMARRMRHIALRPHANDAEREAAQSSDHYDIAGWMLAHRVEVLRDLLTIARAHHIAGQPSSGSSLDSFDEWCRWCAWPIWWASGYCPSKADPPPDATRGTGAARIAAVSWWEAFGDKRVTAASIVSTCTNPDAVTAGADPRRAGAVLELAAALAELAGVPSLARVSPGSLGGRIASRIAGRSWEHPQGRVTIERNGVTHGAAAYRARLDAYEPQQAPRAGHPDDDTTD